MGEIKALLGEPVATYKCDNGFELLEYKPKLIARGGRYLIFTAQKKFLNTTDNHTGCQRAPTFESTNLRAKPEPT
ncbi:MAG: hypothetical protein IDH49_01990 [Gammaproteobacteria bacterium]|nr:hypothetical protein [Gammaproteobacteria bacterium]